MNIRTPGKWTKFLFPAAFLAIAAFLFWRCRFGFADIDECYYIAMPYRFWQGDAMLAQEWSMIQLGAFLMMPAMHLIMAILGSTDGIVLAFRYLFVIVWSLGCLYCWFRLRRIDPAGLGRGLAALILMSYVPFGINALSYNSMGILFLAMHLCTMVSCTPKDRLSLTFAGFLLAAAVLCCPFLAVLYLLYSIAVFLLPRKLRSREESSLLTPGAWCFVTIGAAVLAVIFLAYVFSRASLPQILDALPYIMGDETHKIPMSDKLVQLFLSPIRKYYACLPEFALVAAAVAAACWFRFRKKPYPAGILLAVSALCILAATVQVFITQRYINLLPLPMNLLVLAAYLIPPRRSRAAKLLLRWVWIPGLIYSLCLHLASDQQVLAISSASVTALVGGLPIAALAAGELDSQKLRPVCAAVAAAAAALVLCQLQLRYEAVFWDTNIHDQTAHIEIGPEKGVVARPERVEAYLRQYETIRNAEEQCRPERVLFVTDGYSTLYYLMGDVRTASTSSWIAAGDRETLLRAYFEHHPEMLPDMIYIENDESYIAWLTGSGDYAPMESDEAIIYTRIGGTES